MPRREGQFQTVRSEGAILPPDFLQRIAAGEVDGLDPASYHLPSGTKTKEAISQAWTQLLKHWRDFKAARANGLKSDETGTAITNEKWLLPLFQELRYGWLTTTKSQEIAGKIYPIERFWTHVPIHLIGFRLSLDHRTKGARGAATAIPHSMVQEFLNRSPGHMWAFLSNGLQLRILRDNAALSRQAYVEFDLESMMDGEVYADFALLWLICHQSRLQADKPENCWLEKWSKAAQEQGTRMLKDLRVGVAKAIELLGRGFIAHSANSELLEKLQSGKLSRDDYYRQILRIVYRLLFLFVAEDRGLLHLLPPSEETERAPFETACSNYDRFYSTRRLRDLAESYRGSKHADLWHALSLVFDALGRDEGCPALALPALGSFLWSPTATPDLAGPQSNRNILCAAPVFIRNEDLLDAVRALAFVEKGRVLRSVDYRNLGSEELGSVYESLLELHPDINVPGRTFTLSTAAGNERKTTGSYYTPDSLVQCLLDSALEPVVAEAIKGKEGSDADAAILKLKVCDPACGSGHFLIGAAHRLARHLARARTGESEASPSDYQHALREVIGHCIYGVDVNPMAVELCKVSLWMEALEPGKPLSFLDHRIQLGNSLLGATPALLARGIPDAAFEPIEGDDRALCKAYKKQNKEERKGQMHLFTGARKPWEQLGNLAASLATLDAVSDETIDGVRFKQRSYEDLIASSTYETGRLLADAWCAAFVWKKTKEFDYPITEVIFRKIEKNPHDIAPWMREEIRRLARQYQFFHWHLAFPDVFKPVAPDPKDDEGALGWHGGFAAVLGNPPWEGLQSDAQEFFATTHPEIANAASMAARDRLLNDLGEADPETHGAWVLEQRRMESVRHLLKEGSRFPLTTDGRLNTYSLFGELGLQVISSSGRAGLILPVGIATDAFNQRFFRALVSENRLVSLFGFENEEFIFPNVHHAFKFALLTASGQGGFSEARLGFFLRSVDDLNDVARTYLLTTADFQLINPNTVTCPVFRNETDARLTRECYRRFPVIFIESTGRNTWGTKCQLMFMMNSVSAIARTRNEMAEALGDVAPSNAWADAEWLPLYEAKMFHQFDHRFGTYYGQTSAQANQGKLPELGEDEHRSPDLRVVPQFWVCRSDIIESLGERADSKWLICWRDVTSAVVTRTAIAAILPFAATNDSAPIVHLDGRSGIEACAFVGNLNSYALDFFCRQKLGGNHLRFFTFYQLPVIPPEGFADRSIVEQGWMRWIASRVVELSYTSWELEAFGIDCGYAGPPFIWSEDRRFQMRCELDAAYFHLYAISRDDVAYVMSTFPIVERREIERFGRYRTKDTILETYDAMADAARTGTAYATRLFPPPGPPADAAGNFIPMDQWTEWPPHIHSPKAKLKTQAAAPADGDLVLQVYAFLYVAGVAVEVEMLRRGVLLMRNDALRRMYLDGKVPTRANVTSSVTLRSLRGLLRGQVKAGYLIVDGDLDGIAQVRPDPQHAPAGDSLKATAIGKTAFQAAEEAKRALVSLRGRERMLDQLAEEYDATSAEPVR